MKFTSCKHRFQHISGIHTALCFTGTDQIVNFIDKQNDISFCLLHFLQNGFQTLLKFTTVFRTRNQRTHIQLNQLLFLQGLRDIALHNTPCNTFHNRGFTNTRFTDQHRIVFCLTGQDLNDTADFIIPSDNWIDFTVFDFLHQITSVFTQRLQIGLRIR